MRSKPSRWLASGVLVAYGAVLIRFVVFKDIPTIHVGHIRFRFAGTHTGPPNFVPFRTIVPQLIGHGNQLIAMVNLLGNIIPFIPLGLLARVAVPSFSWRKAVILGIATGLTCEGMEVVFRVGIFDVDDLMLNAFGVIVGYGVFAMVKRRAELV